MTSAEVLQHQTVLVKRGLITRIGPANQIKARMPRYQKFTDATVQLLRAQVQFVEIAGNRQIMVTTLVPRNWSFDLPAGELLFASDVLTDRLSKRAVLRMPVARLGVILNLPIEHIYDY